MTTIAEAQDTVSAAPGFPPEQIEVEIASRLPEEARASGQPVIVDHHGSDLRRQDHAAPPEVRQRPCAGGRGAALHRPRRHRPRFSLDAARADAGRRRGSGAAGDGRKDEHRHRGGGQASSGPSPTLIDAMKGAGYKVELVGLTARPGRMHGEKRQQGPGQRIGLLRGALPDEMARRGDANAATVSFGLARLKGRGDLIPDCGPAIRQSR